MKPLIAKKLLFLITLVLRLTTGVACADDSSNNDITNLVTVSDPRNAPDSQRLGAIDVSYQIGKYEVTAGEYCDFLNAVAWKEDPHGLYHTGMSSDQAIACITRATNTDGTFNYKLIPGRENLPITYVSLNDAERFCNWKEKGAPIFDQKDSLIQQKANVQQQLDDCVKNTLPVSDQLNGLIAQEHDTMVAYDAFEQATENGAYNFTADENGNETVETDFNAHYHIPSQNEWVKAAYYKGNGTNAGYWMYPTRNNTCPTSYFHQGNSTTNLANIHSFAQSLFGPDLKIFPVNACNNTMSFYQACDMAGNVAEWTTDITSSGLAVARGGSWESECSWYGYNDLMRTAPPKSYDPSQGTNFIGFRIAYYVDGLPSAANNEARTISLPNNTPSTQAKGLWPSLTPHQTALLALMFVQGITLGESSLGFIAFEVTLDLLRCWDFERIAGTFPATRWVTMIVLLLINSYRTANNALNS